MYVQPDLSMSTHQLCLDLVDLPIRLGPGFVRPIPTEAIELFALSDESPSGLVRRVPSRNGRCKAGDFVGSKVKGRDYFMVSIKSKMYYAHRIVYYLRTNQNPGSMVVRHLPGNNLILGWQSENRCDDIGKKKRQSGTYRTLNMYLFEGKVFNLSHLCRELSLPYGKVYTMIRTRNIDVKSVFMELAGVVVSAL